MLKFTIYSALTAPIIHHKLTSMSNTVWKIGVGKYFSQLVRADKLSSGKCTLLVDWGWHLVSCRVVRVDKWSRLDRQSCRVENASHLFANKAKILHESCKGTSLLDTVYASFFKQRSDISRSKEQACGTLVYASFFKERSDISHAKVI